jgi:hypothetical protein
MVRVRVRVRVRARVRARARVRIPCLFYSFVHSMFYIRYTFILSWMVCDVTAMFFSVCCI